MHNTCGINLCQSDNQDGNKMIVAIPSSGKNMDSRVDSRFGRAVGFILHNTEDGTHRHVANNLDELALEGAGVQAARFLIKEKVEAVITGHCGPKAFHLFTEAGVVIYSGVEGTVSMALENLAAGELKILKSADVKDHWF